MTNHEPTIASLLRQLANEYVGPVEEQHLFARVLELRPSSAKHPYTTIRERLRWDGLNLGWLRLSRRQLLPLRVALQGLRFRCQPHPHEVEAGLLTLSHLQPFVGLHSGACTLRDSEGARIPYLDLDTASTSEAVLSAFDLKAFYQRTAFHPGDSLLVTITSAEPLGLVIEREASTAFRAGAVAAQDAELLEAMVERVRRAHTTLIACDEIILPIFATAPWRTTYPGSAWQHLLLRDGRLQIVDDRFLSDQLFGTDPHTAYDYHSADTALFAEIDALQSEIGRARQLDVEAGLWSGQVQRASATYGFLDTDLAERPFFGGLDEPDEASWEVDAPWEATAAPPEATLDPNDPAILQAARDRLFALLPPNDTARLRLARPEEAEVIIASHLNMLLARAPELFPRIDQLPPNTPTDANLSLVMPPDWQDEWDDEAEDEVGADFEVELTANDNAFAVSSDLISQFYDYLLEMGKREATARGRARALNIYADFLAAYYGRSLAEGDYATLDECFFYYYPQRVMNSSVRQVRETATALKQLYAFLRQRGVVTDDRFAEALWNRRGQAARVVELYERIAREAHASPSFELLFERLFQPYTT